MLLFISVIYQIFYKSMLGWNHIVQHNTYLEFQIKEEKNKHGLDFIN